MVSAHAYPTFELSVPLLAKPAARERKLGPRMEIPSLTLFVVGSWSNLWCFTG